MFPRRRDERKINLRWTSPRRALPDSSGLGLDLRLHFHSVAVESASENLVPVLILQYNNPESPDGGPLPTSPTIFALLLLNFICLSENGSAGNEPRSCSEGERLPKARRRHPDSHMCFQNLQKLFHNHLQCYVLHILPGCLDSSDHLSGI